MFIFATDEGINLLQRCGQWFGDGTFKLCTEIFCEIYTIHALTNHEVIPCAFGLLPAKTQLIYERFMTTLRNAVGNDPECILVDFEDAAINAFRNILSGAQISGCYFHLYSNLRERVQRASLQERYADDDELVLKIRMIAAPAFVPPQDVINAFEQLADIIRNEHQAGLDDVLDYFEGSYIGTFQRNAPRRPPLFPIELWNMFNRTDDELPRTNNSIEGWHHSFHSNVSSCHPSFWKFIEVLQSEERIFRVKLLQNQGGILHQSKEEGMLIAMP